jgi:VCBS repeat-containing protein
MPTIAQSGPGIVTALWGKALIRGADGKMRVLKVGDAVQPGDLILTTQDGIVQIHPVDDPRAIAAAKPAAGGDEIDRVIAGLNEGDAQVAPAAGVAGGGDGSLDAGLRVERIAEGLTPGGFVPNAGETVPVRTIESNNVVTSRSSGSSTEPPAPPPPPPALVADSSNISAAEEGAPTALGLEAPSGGTGTATIVVDQVPTIGEVRKADGTPVTAGMALTAAELTGLTYVPPADYDGTAPVGSFNYSVTSNGETASGGTTIALAAVNDAPIATPASVAGLEDGTLPVSLAGTDVDGVIAGVGIVSVPAGGTLTLADGSTAVVAGQTLTPAQAAGLLYRPAPDTSGNAAIVFTVTDNGGRVSAPASVGLVVTAVNDTPVAANDTVAATEDQPVTFDPRANDSDADGDTLAIVAIAGQPIAVGSPVTLPQGTVALNADGTLTFTPNPDFNGTVSFGYTVSDGTTTASAGVSLNVAPVPDAAVIGGQASGATVEDTTLAASGSLTIVDPDAGEAAFVAQTNVAGAHGTFSVDATGHWTYTLNNADPAVQALGAGQSLPAESFTVASIDGTTRVVTVTITGTNDAAVINAGVGSVSEDGVLSTGGTLAISDVDSGEAAFVAQPATAGSHGSFTLGANGAWTYTLDNTSPAVQALGAGQTLTETFAVASLDGTLSSVTVTVNGTNDAAVIAGTATGGVTEDGLLTTGGTLTVSDADAGQASFVAQPATPGSWGSFTLAADGTWSYALNNALPVVQALGAGQTLSETFTVVTADGTSSSVVVTINGSDDAPVISTGTGTVTENTAPSASGTLTATDVDNTALAFVPATTGGAYGALTLAANGAWTYTLDARAEALAQGQSVSEVIAVALNDGSTTTVTITVTGTNDAPVAQAAAANIAEGGALLNGAVSATDIDTAAVLGYALNGAAPAGLVFNADGTYSFDPANAAYDGLGVGQSTVLTVPYTVTDEHGASSTADLVITVTGTNDAPVASADSGAVNESATLTVAAAGGVLVNDTDVDTGDTRAVSGVAFGAQAGTVGAALVGTYGTLTLNADGSYSYSADQTAAAALLGGQIATESFTYTMRDAAGATATATITFTITGSDGAPTITGPLAGSVTEDTTLGTGGTLTIVDPDAGQSSFVAQSGTAGSYGSFSISAAGVWTYALDNAAANVQSLPAGASVTDSFTITSADGTTRSIVVTVNGTNDGPVAVGSSFSVAENTAIVNGSVGATDVDAGAVLSYALAGAAPAGLVFNADGSYAFDPSHPAYQSLAVGQSTVLTVPFTASDAQGAGSSANLVITVTGTNDTPAAQATSFSVAEGSAVVNGNVIATDADGGAVPGYALDVAAPAGLVFNADGSYSFDPDASAYNGLAVGQSVTLTLPYTATDEHGASSSANLVITVTGTNDTPVAQPVLFPIAEDAPVVSGNVVASDPDAGAVLTYALVGPAPAGLVLDADGSYTFDPAHPAYQALGPGQVQVINAPYLVTDEHGAGAFAGFVIIVTGTNDAPVAQAAAVTVAEDAGVAGAVVATDVDTGAVLSYTLNGVPPAGLVFNTNGSYSFDASGPAWQSLGLGQSVVLTIPYTVTDQFGADSTADLVVTITGTNDAPVAQAASFAVSEDAAVVNGNVAAGDVDANAVLGYTLNGAAPAGLVFDADGSYRFDASNAAYQSLATGQVQVLTVPYTVTDQHGASSTANLVITITGTNDAAVITGVAAGSVTEDGTLLATGTLAATDVDGPAPFTAANVAGTYGNFSIDAAGQWSYTLRNGDANVQALTSAQQPTETFTVTTADGTVHQITVTVNGTNEAPVATVTPASGAEDAAGIPVTLSGSDVDGSVASFTITTLPANGTLFFGGAAVGLGAIIPASAGSAALSFVPAANWNGSTSIGFTATDAEGASSPAVSQSISVTAVNDAPVASDDSASTPINTPLASISVLANDGDVDGDALSVVSAALADPALGAVSINPDGTLAFNPALNVTGPVLVNYTVRDPSGATSSATLTVNVGTNTAPTGADATVTLAEDGSRAFAPADFGFADADAGQTLAAVRIDTLPAAGSLTFNGVPVTPNQLIPAGSLGNLVFTPAPNANGNAYASFTFSVQDNAGGYDSAPNTITLNVTPVNDAPVAAGDSFATDEDQSISIPVASLLANDSDVEPGPLSVVSVQGAVQGTVALVAGNVVFTPAADYHGPASFTYTIADGQGGTATATVAITVNPVNDPALIGGDDLGAVTEDLNVLAGRLNDSGTLTVADVDAGEAAFVAGAGTPVGANLGTLAVAANGAWTYDVANADVQYLAAGQTRTEAFTVRSIDGTTHTVSVTITGTNDAPVASASSFSIAEDAAVVNGSVGSTDADAGAIAGYALTGAAPAGLSFNADGSYSFDPAVAAYQSLGVGQSTVITVPFRVTDDQGASSVANLVITVTGTNDGPSAVADSGSVAENATLAVTAAGGVLVNDSDVDSGDSKVVSAVTFGATSGAVGAALNGTYGTLTLNADGSYSYSANRPAAEALAAGQIVTESFAYTMRDAAGATSTATITFTVTGTDDVPTITGPLAGSVTEDTTLSTGGTLAIVDADAGQSSFAAQIGTAGTYGSFSITAGGVWTYSLDNAAANVQSLPAGASVTDSFTVTSADGTTRSIVVTLHGTNDGPVAVGSSVSIAEDAAIVNGAVAATDVDAGAVLGYALTGAAPAGLVFNADGSYSFNPAVAAYQSLGVGQSTVLTIPFTATDAQGASSTANLVITVTGTNDAPTAVADTGAVNENATLAATAATGVLANDTDVDTADSKAVSAVAFGATAGTVGAALNGTYGTLTLNADGSYSYGATRPAAEALTAGQVVTESFSYTMRDAAGATSTTTITFTITGTNDVPTITGPLAGSVTEDSTLTSTGTLIVADADAGQSSWVAQAGTAGTYGSFSIDAAGAWSYTLDNAAANVQSLPAGAVATDSFTVTTADGTTRTVVVTVNGTNDGPVAVGSSVSVAEDAAVVNGAVTATDVDTGAVLGYALTGAAPAGLSFNADGSYSFNPAHAAYQSLGVGQSTVVTVPFRATDAQGASSVANLVITVTGTNDAPTAVADTGAVNENATLTTTAASGVLANDTDVDAGDSKAVSAVSFGATSGTVGTALNGTYGSLTLNADGSYSYSANRPAAEALAAGQVVTESFTYTMRDAAGATSTATITFTVTGTNDVPTITGPLTGSTAEDTTLTSTGTLVVTDPDAGQSTWVAQSGTSGTYGSFAITAAGAWTYTLNNAAANVQALPAGAVATDSFTVTSADGTTRTVVVTVNGTNDGPVAAGSSFSVAEDAAVVNGAVTATDVDAGAVLAYALTGAAPAGLVFNTNGTYSFNPSVAAYQSLGVGQSTVLTIPFTATDAQGASSTANLVITVIGTNDGPTALADTGALNENGTLTTTAATGVLANDTDVDAGDTRSVSAVAFGATNGTVGAALAGTYGTLTLNANGSYSYSASRPAADALTAGQVVTESFSYTMRDAAGATSTTTITFTITGTNDVPTITGPLTGSVTEDSTLTSTGTLTIVDADAGQSSFVSQGGTAGTYGSFAITAAGVWTYTLNNAAANVQSLPAGAVATDSFTVTSADGTTRTVVVTVNGTNDGPVAVGSSFSVAEDAAVVNGAVAATDVDTGAVLGYALTGAAPAGLTFNTNGSYSFNPSAAAYQSLGVGQSTVLTIPFTATDAQGASSTANLVITVTGTNDGPVAVADTGAVNENATLTTTAATGVLANDTDVDSGDTRAVSAVAFGATNGTVGAALNGTYGTLTLNANGSYSYVANRPAAEALTAGQVVTEQFTYTMRDAAGATSSTTITFTVTGTNDVPTITGPLTGSATEDTTLTSAGTLVVTDADAGQSSFVAQGGTAGAYGSFAITAAGAWTYTLNNAAANVQSLRAGVSVTDSFTVTTADGTTRTVVVTVNGSNDGPVAVADLATAVEAGGVGNATAGTNPSGNVLTNDTDVDSGDTRTVSAVTGTAAGTVGGSTAGSYGTLTLNADGSYSYALNNSLAAVQALRTAANTLTDSFTYTVRDASGATSSTTLTVTIQGANDAPVATIDTGALNENATLTRTAATGVLANDTDVDAGDTRTVSAVAFGATNGTVGSALNGTYGALTLNADGSYNYSANRPAVEALTAGQVVTESFTYTVRDTAGATSIATVTFTITGTNDVPTITGPLAGSVTEDTTLTSTGSLVVTDPDAGQSSWVAQSGTAGTYGSFSINAAGAWTYTLNNAAGNVQALPAGTSVTDSFTVTTADGTTRTVVVTVNGTNDAPTVVAETRSTNEDTAVTGNVLANDSDIDGGALALTQFTFGGTTVAAGGTATIAGVGSLTIASNGAYTFTPAAHYGGAVPAASYVVSDGSASSSSTLSLSIVPVADAPTLVVNGSATTGGTTTPQTIPPSVGLTVQYYDNIAAVNATNATTIGNVETGVESSTATSTGVATDVSVADIGADDAYRYTGYIYLNGGTTYTIAGYRDDTLMVKIGGNSVYAVGFNNWGNLTGTAFTPAVSGYYSLEVIAYNGDGVGSLDLSMQVGSAAAVDLNTTNFRLYPGTSNFSGSGTVVGGMVPNGDGGYYPTSVVGTEDNTIPLGTIAGSLNDTDGSETLALRIGAIPVGATISDGVRTFTATAGTTSVDVSGWTLNAISFTPAANAAGTFNLTVSATSTDSNGSTATSQTALPVTVVATADAPTLAGATTVIAMVQGNSATSTLSLPVLATLNDIDGSEVLSVSISGVPTGATLNHGTNNGGGTWTLAAADLADLTMTLPAAYSTNGTTLTITAVSTESSNGATASTTTTVNLIADFTGNTAITGSTGDDTSLNGNNNNNFIDALAGNDTIDARGGDDLVRGGDGADNITGGSGNDVLFGDAGNDVISGGDGNDRIVGGAGNDTLTGGANADVFAWTLADAGGLGTPAVDTITDFNTGAVSAGGDVLDLRDLLGGEALGPGNSAGNLANYLDFEVSGSNTTIHISSNGGFTNGYSAGQENQSIVLQGVNLPSALGLAANATDAQIIQELLGRGKLIVDNPGG